jgi:glutamate dehydrogenase (NADP+)
LLETGAPFDPIPEQEAQMKDYVSALMDEVRARNPAEREFHQAVEEVAESLVLVFERHPEYRSSRILERMVEPEVES